MTLSEIKFVSFCHSLTKEPEMLHPDAFCKHTMQQNATAIGALPGPLCGSLQRSPRPLAGFKGATSRREGEGKGREGERKGEEGKGRRRQGGRGRGGEGRLTLIRSWNRTADWLRPAYVLRPTCIM